MEAMALNFGVILGFITKAVAIIKDPRQVSNATRYSIKDTVLAAFSVFFMQCESFLEHQRQMHRRCGQDNCSDPIRRKPRPENKTILGPDYLRIIRVLDPHYLRIDPE